MFLFTRSKRLLRTLVVAALGVLPLLSQAAETAAKPTQKAKVTSTQKSTATKSTATTRTTKTKKTKKTTAKRTKNTKKSDIRTITVTYPTAYKPDPASNPDNFTPARASLHFNVNGKLIPYQRFFHTASPGETLTFSLANTFDPYELQINNQVITQNNHRWTWQAPNTPGLYQLVLTEKLTHKTLNLGIFVLTPLKAGSQTIGRYKIGRYPAPKDGKKEYLPPKGFIEVNAKNAGYWISPHFQLGRFLCKQKCSFPAYLALEPALIEKLELLLEAYNQKGGHLHTFEIMSGYRTPSYNKSIRNVQHSRHIYGSAADIFVDVNPRDGKMDDLNQDGKFNKQDASVLYDLADKISDKYHHLAGGVGQYSANSAHGPFVHVDVRGSEARWGK